MPVLGSRIFAKRLSAPVRTQRHLCVPGPIGNARPVVDADTARSEPPALPVPERVGRARLVRVEERVSSRKECLDRRQSRVGRHLAQTHIVCLVKDLDMRIIHATTGDSQRIPKRGFGSPGCLATPQQSG